MALFEGETIDNLEEGKAGNIYLDNPEKGLGLIKSLLSGQGAEESGGEFQRIISEEIFPILAQLRLEGGLDVYSFLTKAADRLKEQRKMKLLAGKKVLGIGGKFSSGKSCFINSIADCDLPEGQRPTTSIATYIIKADRKKNIAVSNNDNEIMLDDEAVAALTHQFYERYQIGFSKLIKSLAAFTPNFPFPNIAILDTPGYSKADTQKDEDSSDAAMACTQLNSVDYLIWLVDSNNGEIISSDLEFLARLNISSKILVVFTKAALLPENAVAQVIEQAKRTLEGINKEIYGVIAYDSVTGETIIGKGVLEAFLSMINDSAADSGNLEAQVRDMCISLGQQIAEQIAELQKETEDMERVLVGTSNIEHISSVVWEYGKCKAAMTLLKQNRKKLNDSFDRLIAVINTIGAV